MITVRGSSAEKNTRATLVVCPQWPVEGDEDLQLHSGLKCSEAVLQRASQQIGSFYGLCALNAPKAICQLNLFNR
jgi:hypothetical protein